MFERELKYLEMNLDIPYPERTNLIQEIESDLLAALSKFRDAGLPDEKAAKRALAEFLISGDSISAIEDVHKTKIKRILDSRPATVTSRFYDFVGMIPTIILVSILYKEVPAMAFLEEGGLIIYGILALGLFGVLIQLRSMFRWWIVRDHSRASLAQHSRLPLFIGFSVFLLGVLGTAIAYYAVFYRWSNTGLSEADLRIGLREPIPCLIVGTSLAALIFIMQGTIEHWFRNIPSELTSCS